MLTAEQEGKFGDARGYLHPLRRRPPRLRAVQQEGHGPHRPEGAATDVTINQITWQVGSLKEVNDAATWLPRERRRCSASAATCPAPTGTATSTTPPVTPTSSTTASSRSAGRATASRAHVRPRLPRGAGAAADERVPGSAGRDGQGHQRHLRLPPRR